MRTPLVLMAAIAMFGCSSLTLQNVDFAWPVESVLTVGRNGDISDPQRGLSVNLTPLSQAELQDSAALRGTKVRVIRSAEGLYFLTSARFKNVYVFSPGEKELSLKKAIEVSPQGLREPALNQRPPYVELLDPSLTKPTLLSSSGVVEGGAK
jgi:hypothetical protein